MAFRNKVFVITGSAGGLGKGFAEAVLKEGGLVTISDVSENAGHETTVAFAKKYGSEKVHFVHCDVTNESQFSALWDASEAFFKAPVDVLVNNAGINHLQGWKKCMDIDINALMYGSYMALDRMGRSKGGRGGLVINIASMAGLVTIGEAASSCYFAAKHAVVGLTRSLGSKHILQSEGVKFACLCPFYANTDIIKAPELQAHLMKTIGSENIMTVDKVAEAFVGLVQDGVNGGALCIMPHALPFYFPDANLNVVYWLAFGARLGAMLQAYRDPTKKTIDRTIFGKAHQMAYLALTLFVLYLAFKLFLCFLC